MICRRGQYNFVWIFAIIAGGAILALAIYGAVRGGNTIEYQKNTEIAKGISVVSNPLQAGFADGSFGKMIFGEEVRINNFCFDGGFGRNEISVSTRSRDGDWGLEGGATSIRNKYIFSSEVSASEIYYVFSKPFNFPYEVADMTFMMSDNYCFANAPEEVVDEISGFGIPNIEVGNCSFSDAVNVCFGRGSDCDMIVYGSCNLNCDSVFDEGVVSKGGEDLYYVGDLMYGAIFSDEEVYDCNVNRLLYRASKISEVFVEKADLMNARNCNVDLKSDLLFWKSFLGNSSSSDLIYLGEISDSLDKKNVGGCGLW